MDGVSSEQIKAYEGLCFSTAALIFKEASSVGLPIEDDFDDVVQMLRIKVGEALVTYVSGRSKLTENNYVFMCVMNLKKDVLKRKRRYHRSVDALRAPAGANGNTHQTGDWFDGQYLLYDAAPDYDSVEDEGLTLPSTLSPIERQVVAYLYAGYQQVEAAVALGLTKGEMEGAVRRIRLKLADWQPARAAEPAPVDLLVAA